MMDWRPRRGVRRMPKVGAGFWLLTLMAMVAGETAADAVSMTLHINLVVAVGLLLTVFAISLTAQVRAPQLKPYLYWALVTATAGAGTAMADLLRRQLHHDERGAAATLVFLAALGCVWAGTRGKLALESITSRRGEVACWIAILAFNTVGTTLGDYARHRLGLDVGLMLFLFTVAALAISSLVRLAPWSVMFWAVYAFLRPLGVNLADALQAPLSSGGMALNRVDLSAATLAVMAVMIFVTSLRLAPKAANAN